MSPSKKQILIVCAQIKEAQTLIERLAATPIEGMKVHSWFRGVIPSCYLFDQGKIVISNVGVFGAHMAVAQHGPSSDPACDEVWNIGFAGALKEGYPVGQIVPISYIGKYTPIIEGTLDERSLECLSTTLPPLSLNGKAADQSGRLVTSDFPIHHPYHRLRLSPLWDLVDMEGYGIASACSHLNIKCQMWKIVSDFTSAEGRELIRKHRSELAEKLAETVIAALEKQT